MANRDAPRGLTPVNNRCLRNRYYVGTDAGILGIGDAVVRQTASADPKGYPEVVKATVGAAMTGVIVAIEPGVSRENSMAPIASADTGYVLVADDPNELFKIQDNGGATGLAITAIGTHIDLVTAIDADSVTGRAKSELDTEAAAADNSFVVVRADDSPDNDPSLANADWIVKANLHTEVNASATNVTEI